VKLLQSNDLCGLLGRHVPVRGQHDRGPRTTPFLPDTAYLDDLPRTRERLAAASSADESVRTAAAPSDQEISKIRQLINRAAMEKLRRLAMFFGACLVRTRLSASMSAGAPSPDCCQVCSPSSSDRRFSSCRTRAALRRGPRSCAASRSAWSDARVTAGPRGDDPLAAMRGVGLAVGSHLLGSGGRG